jgi:hypothetical protein
MSLLLSHASRDPHAPLGALILLDGSQDPVGFMVDVGGAVLGLLAVVVVGWFAIARIRAWMRTSEDESAPFTLDDLRALRRDGKLSEEEFARAREAMIGAVRSGLGRESSTQGSQKDPPGPQDRARARADVPSEGTDADEATAPKPAGPRSAPRDGTSLHGETVIRRPSMPDQPLRRSPHDGRGRRDE